MRYFEMPFGEFLMARNGHLKIWPSVRDGKGKTLVIGNICFG